MYQGQDLYNRMATQEIKTLAKHRADMGEQPKDEARKRDRTQSVAHAY